MLLVTSQSVAIAQGAANDQLQAMAAQQRQRAEAIDQEISRFESQHLPTLPADRKAVAIQLVETKRQEIQIIRNVAAALEQNDQAKARSLQQTLAAVSSQGQIHFQHLKLLETRDRLAQEVAQLESEQADVPAGLANLFNEMLSARRAAQQKYRDAAAAFGTKPSSIDAVNAVGQAKGAEMESAFKHKAFVMNQQIVQFRQIAQQSDNADVKQVAQQLEQVTTSIINESRKELDAQWAIYQLQMQQQLLAAQIEQMLQQ